jgi:murein DD-endopeptidase MepM/ murein hydrolase activator NlpD
MPPTTPLGTGVARTGESWPPRPESWTHGLTPPAPGSPALGVATPVESQASWLASTAHPAWDERAASLMAGHVRADSPEAAQVRTDFLESGFHESGLGPADLPGAGRAPTHSPEATRAPADPLEAALGPTMPWAIAVIVAPASPPSVRAGPGADGSVSARQSRLSWPLSPVPVITKYFDAPDTPFGPGHRGVDLAAVPGQDVLAADAGVVVFAGAVGGRPVLSVDHDGGLRTTYEPVVPKVAVGDQVYRGQVLGTVLAGHPGCTVAACLHWGVRRGEEYVDPLALTGEVGEYRLKPWGGGR